MTVFIVARIGMLPHGVYASREIANAVLSQITYLREEYFIWEYVVRHNTSVESY